MPETRMLPGEQVEFRLRPHRARNAGGYALAALFLAEAAALSYAARQSSEWGAMAIIAILSLDAALAFAVGSLRRDGLAGAAIAVAPLLALALGFTLWAPCEPDACTPETVGMPAVLGAEVVLFLILMEADRSATRVTATNLRLLKTGGLRRNEVSVRYTDLQDIDARQGALGRLLDTGTLIAVPTPAATPPAPAAQGGPGPPPAPPPAFPGLHPFGKVHEAVRLLVQRAGTSPLLRREADIDGRLERALEALQRRGRGTNR